MSGARRLSARCGNVAQNSLQMTPFIGRYALTHGDIKRETAIMPLLEHLCARVRLVEPLDDASMEVVSLLPRKQPNQMRRLPPDLVCLLGSRSRARSRAFPVSWYLIDLPYWRSRSRGSDRRARTLGLAPWGWIRNKHAVTAWRSDHACDVVGDAGFLINAI
jgi:hypothetical protein